MSCWSSDTGGTGRGLVLLHAFPLSSRIYDDLVAALAARGRRVVCVDLPGLGRSAATGEPSMTSMAAGVVDVLARLGLDDVDLLGTSTGGYVALEIARTTPERVASLVLASSTPFVGPPDVPDERRHLAGRLEETRDRGLLTPLVDDGLGPTARRDRPELHDLLLDLVAQTDPDGVAWAARAIASRHDTSAVLAELAAPVLLLFGAEDTATPPELAARLAELRGDRPTRQRVLASTGHLTALERPDLVADELTAFHAVGGR